MSTARPSFADETLRQITRISVGGDRVRVRFSNAFGSAPLTIDAASIAIRSSEDEVVASTLNQLSFEGEASVTIPPGSNTSSDPVDLAVEDHQDLSISIYISNETLAETIHENAFQTNYVASGNATLAPSMSADETLTQWYWLSGVDVYSQHAKSAVVTLGDSITDGLSTTLDANNRWPDVLSRRLLDAAGEDGQQTGILNAAYQEIAS